MLSNSEFLILLNQAASDREKLAALLQTGRLDTLPLITHRFHGFEHMEEALLLMKNKPRDLIKPVVILD